MTDYTVSVTGDYEHALAYVQEIYAGNWHPEVEEGETPPPPPTLAQMPQVLVDADLTNRLREMEARARDLVTTLAGIPDEAMRQQLAQTLIHSPALRALCLARLAQEEPCLPF